MVLDYTVIRFVSTNAKFGICTVMCLNGTLVEDKMHIFYIVNVNISASTSVPFRPTTLQLASVILSTKTDKTDKSVVATCGKWIRV